MTGNLHIALLAGGMSSEREVSFLSAKGVEKALHELGHKVTLIDVGRDIASKLNSYKFDLAFNALHGKYGEDGCIQGLLEILQIPYTHSGIMASAVAMDKQQTKNIVSYHNITCPKGIVASTKDILAGNISIKPPLVLKPPFEGSSVGVHIVKDSAQMPSKDILMAYKEYMMEEYIEGQEISVAVTDQHALGVIEIKPYQGFYDYTHKYTDGKTEHIFPAQIPDKIYEQVMDSAYAAHKLLKCSGISRSDFIYEKTEDKAYFLELNTHPGLTPLSLLPEIARHKGIDFNQLVEYLIQNVKCEK